MKKLISSSNPFILILLPVVFALVMGVGYQFEQSAKAAEMGTISLNNVKRSTSLFVKGVSLVKTICGVTKTNVW